MALTLALENNFKGGLITEATGLNFPEGACTETYDCEFDSTGTVRRRFGFDFEKNFSTRNVDRTDCAVVTYLWKNVAGNGDITLMVVQIGSTLFFYETNISGTYSTGAVATTATLTPVTGQTATTVSATEAQFSDGNGLLFVTHPYCDPFYISYDITSHIATQTSIDIMIRDFEGATADPYAVNERPTATLAGLNVSHKYNLYNQGWNTTNLTAWDTAQTTMPSNSDVMWQFEDSSGDFAASNAAIARVIAGNSPAPKGFFVLSLADGDRDTAAGLSGVATTTPGSQRPSTSAFFAGRVFYAGVNKTGFNTKIYFSQIVERPSQYAYCYQVNDPTSEDLFDLLPSDGGVVSIPDAGTILKLIVIPGGLCVFAQRGVWLITGSTGIGFTASDYTVQKVSAIETLSHTSFVNVNGYPCWWNPQGIYIMSAGENQQMIQTIPLVQSLTDHKIRTFYNGIPLSSKRYSRGFYHVIDNHIRWVYRSTEATRITEVYEYDRVLSFNILTGAFYPWRVSDSIVKINSILSSDLTSKAVSADNVVDNSSNPLIDGDGNIIIAFSNIEPQDPFFDKYLVSYLTGPGSYTFTFADKINGDYVDWQKYDLVGVNFTSYLISGFKLPGGAVRKFQNNWLRVFSKMDVSDQAYFFQGIWDFATTGTGTGKWSTKQYVNHSDANYSTKSAKLKVRGHGIALQFRIESVEGQAFNIAGWSTAQGIEAMP